MNEKINKIEKDSQITIIIPVHLLNEDSKKLFDLAVNSVTDQIDKPYELLVVGPKEVYNELKDEINFRFLLNEGKTDFASQINLAVDNVNSDWFCVLELDDELAPTWLSNVNKYKSKYEDVDCFLPVIVNREFSNNSFNGFSNEVVWAAEFSSELGIVDHNCLLGYQGFSLDGMVMKKETFKSHGGLKPCIKLTFIYEFLLRITYFSSTVMVIPKFGYRHMNSRDGSLFESYKNTIGVDEQRWWLALAKKEYFHTKDRGITYEKK